MTGRDFFLFSENLGRKLVLKFLLAEVKRLGYQLCFLPEILLEL